MASILPNEDFKRDIVLIRSAEIFSRSYWLIFNNIVLVYLSRVSRRNRC